jgi:hypothetical protein
MSLKILYNASSFTCNLFKSPCERRSILSTMDANTWTSIRLHVACARDATQWTRERALHQPTALSKKPGLEITVKGFTKSLSLVC